MSSLASTQLEPTEARRMIPCFDEPVMKAQFSLSVIRPQQMNAQSNMEISKTEKYTK